MIERARDIEIQILLVEDNPTDVLVTREALSTAGIRNRLSVVDNGEDAIRFLKREEQFRDAPQIDIVLLDLNVPRRNGIEVLAEIKADKHLRKTPVVILTTSRASEDVQRAYALYASSYLVKPLGLNEFRDMLRAVEDYWLCTVTLP